MRRALLPTLAAVLLTAGCGGEGSALRGPEALRAAPVALRAQLAAALGERAWLVAAAVDSPRAGRPDPGRAQAARTLEAGSVAVADLVGRALGARHRTAALAALRRQDARWRELIAANARGDRSARAAAGAGLRAADAALGSALAVRGLGPRTLARAFDGGTARLASALDAGAAGSPTAPHRLALAAARAARPAGALVLAAERRRDPPLRASARSPAGDLATLAATSFTDAAFAQAALGAARVAGARGRPRLAASRAADDDAARGLGRLVGAVHGADAGRRFRVAWGDGAAALAAYAGAQREGEPRAGTRALATLARADEQLTALLAAVDPDGEPRELAGALRAYAAAATATARAQAAGAPGTGPALRRAAAAARAVGRAFADRAVRQYPSKFPA